MAALLAKMQLTLAADTLLGKQFSGIDLSGGMWQKLAVARALYRSSGVTIFEERVLHKVWDALQHQ